MNGKLLGILSFTMLISNVYGLSINHGKLISHKEWSTSLVSAYSFQDQALPDAAYQSHDLTGPDYFESVNLTDNLASTNVNGKVSEEISLDAMSQVRLSNQRGSTQTYTVLTQLCVYNASFPKECALSSDVFQLDAYGNLLLDRLPSLKIRLDNAGTYTTDIQTTVTKEGVLPTFDFHTTGNLVITQ